MEKKLLFLIAFISFNLSAQNLPSEPSNGAAFPIGSKFTVKMIPTGSNTFDYSILKFEPFRETVDTWETNNLFANDGEAGTIEFYFCLGTNGKTEEEKEKNMKVLLIFKNRTDYNMSYDSEIQLKEEGEYESTSNMGTFKGAKGTEMWPYMIHFIGLSNFKIMN